MEFLQVFERKNGQWSQRYDMDASFKENWVLDKSTDYAKDIKIRYVGEKKPNWKVKDWVRILHVETENEPMTYDDLYRPINSVQYTISGIQFLHDEINGKWIISMTLDEVIERTSGILGETLTYTNQTTKTVTDGDATYTYTHWRGAYNHYTALERWLKHTPANCDDYGPRYNPRNNISWFNRIRIFDEDWLKGIPFADDTLNEMTLYNVLMDKYDASTGRTPVMYFDIDPDTDLPRNMDRDEYILIFERQDGFDKPELTLEELRANTDDTKLIKTLYTQDLNNYATGVVSNIENMSSGVSVVYPAENYYVLPEVIDDVRTIRDNPTYGINGDRDKWAVREPHTIKNIKDVTARYFTASKSTTSDYRTTYVKTLETMPIYERKQYLSAGSDTTDPVKEMNDLYWYTEGESLVHVKPQFFSETGASGRYVYNITYEPLITGRIELGDSDYQVQVNQSSSQVDSDKFGSFLDNYLKSMGKSDLILQKTYTYFNDFKDLIGSRVTDEDRDYIITNVSYVNRGEFLYDVIFQLNENHTRKNNTYQAPQEIRSNVEISYNNLKERMTYIKQTVNIGLVPQPETKNKFLVDKKALLSALAPDTVGAEKCPQVGMLTYTGKYVDRWGVGRTYNYYTTPAKFQIANQVVMNMRFYDNADAGKRKVIIPYSQAAANETVIGAPSYQIPTLYTDPFGEIQDASIFLSNLVSDYIADKPATSVSVVEFDSFVTKFNSMADAPVAKNDVLNAIKNNICAQIYNLHYDKDMLEIMNINIAFEALNYEKNIFICPELLKRSRLIRANDTHSTHAMFFNTKKNISDDLNDYVQDFVVTGTVTGNSFVYDLSRFAGDYKCLVVSAYENGKNAPMLIINENVGGRLEIFFN